MCHVDINSYLNMVPVYDNFGGNFCTYNTEHGCQEIITSTQNIMLVQSQKFEKRYAYVIKSLSLHIFTAKIKVVRSDIMYRMHPAQN